MSKFLFIFIFASLLNTHSLFAQSGNLKMSVGTSFNSKNTLGFYNNVRGAGWWFESTQGHHKLSIDNKSISL